MLCKEVETILEDQGFSPVPEHAREHLANCDACRDLVADFAAILAAAHEIPAEVQPPPRIWVSLRAQLEAEGVIKNPDALAAQPSSRWTQWSAVFRGRAMAFATAGFVVATAVFLQLPSPAPTAPATASAGAPQAFAVTAAALQQQERDIRSVRLASATKVDSSLRQSLEMVNHFIQDCEQRVNAEPQDDLARDYLSGAYQQKADLLAAMMERGGNGY